MADCGDVDVVPISIERTFAAIERELDPWSRRASIPLVRGRRSLHHAAGPARAGAAPRAARPRALRRAPGHVGPSTSACTHYHGSTFRRAIEEGVDRRRHALIQVGIRGPLYGREDFDFHAEHGLEVIRIERREGARRPGVARARSARLRGRPRLSAPSTSTRWTRPTRRRRARPRSAGSPRYEALTPRARAARASTWSAPTSSRCRRPTTGPGNHRAARRQPALRALSRDRARQR